MTKDSVIPIDPVEEKGEIVVLRVFLQPRSARSRMTGIQGDRIKLQIAAPPVGGKANRACIEYLAERLGIAKERVKIVSGHTSRRKTITIQGMKKKDVEPIL